MKVCVLNNQNYSMEYGGERELLCYVNVTF